MQWERLDFRCFTQQKTESNNLGKTFQRCSLIEFKISLNQAMPTTNNLTQYKQIILLSFFKNMENNPSFVLICKLFDWPFLSKNVWFFIYDDTPTSKIKYENFIVKLSFS